MMQKSHCRGLRYYFFSYFLLNACIYSLGAFNLKDFVLEHMDCVVGVRYEKEGKTQLTTGFFVSDEGHVLTPAINGDKFFIEKDSHLTVAEKLGEDQRTQITLLKIKFEKKEDRKLLAKNFVVLSSGTEVPEIGENLVSLSYKLGLNISPQMGFVTGHNDRYFDIEWPITLIRSNLPIDGGDCGGPVFTRKGRFVGMLLHALEDTKETYFMPAWALHRVFSDLLIFGRVRYGYVGLSTTVVWDRKRSIDCLQITEVVPNTSAFRAGFQKNDILLNCNGSAIVSRELLKNFMFAAQPQQTIQFDVLREGNKQVQCNLITEEWNPKK